MSSLKVLQLTNQQLTGNLPPAWGFGPLSNSLTQLWLAGNANLSGQVGSPSTCIAVSGLYTAARQTVRNKLPFQFAPGTRPCSNNSITWQPLLQHIHLWFEAKQPLHVSSKMHAYALLLLLQVPASWAAFTHLQLDLRLTHITGCVVSTAMWVQPCGCNASCKQKHGTCLCVASAQEDAL
jgi:hypothetical protein